MLPALLADDTKYSRSWTAQQTRQLFSFSAGQHLHALVVRQEALRKRAAARREVAHPEVPPVLHTRLHLPHQATAQG